MLSTSSFMGARNLFIVAFTLAVGVLYVLLGFQLLRIGELKKCSIEQKNEAKENIRIKLESDEDTIEKEELTVIPMIKLKTSNAKTGYRTVSFSSVPLITVTSSSTSSIVSATGSLETFKGH
ncbi:unnamed protein product [Orchesella dallaii]|uniref:Uncharacterized protein n=1 Tax=Orchesella dallaii TaxID=48710 RepID=A0ABP1S6Q6_9HEXA